jgi:hypothetical protein
MLVTPPDEPIVQIQRVDHESRVHIDIETGAVAPFSEATRTVAAGLVESGPIPRSREANPNRQAYD